MFQNLKMNIQVRNKILKSFQKKIQRKILSWKKKYQSKFKRNLHIPCSFFQQCFFILFKVKKAKDLQKKNPKSIFFAYDELKDKNLDVKQVLLPRLDLDPTKTRLLSALDFEKGKLNLPVLEPL